MNLPKPNERLVIVGPTRCGKSYLARTLLRGAPNVLVVAPKGPKSWPLDAGDLRAVNLKQLAQRLDEARKTGARVVYYPPREHLLPENSADLDEVAAMALERRNTLLFYDELVYVANGNDFTKRAPHFYFALTTGGSQGVGVWGLCQRPSHIPAIVFTESEYRATFYLRKKSDRDRMEDALGDEVPWDILRRNRHSFVFGDDMETSHAMKLSPIRRAAKGAGEK